MSIGKKIKELRTDRCLTQSQLSGERITRNMLSAIESEKALPSLDTLYYLAEMLEVPPSYLLSEDSDLFLYKKKERIDKIKSLYKEKDYRKCLSLIETLEGEDDEILYIKATAAFYLGRELVLSGSLVSGQSYLEASRASIKKCAYDLSLYFTLSDMYLAVCANIQSPLLDFDAESFESGIYSLSEIDFYKYLVSDPDFDYKNHIFLEHIKIKKMIKSHRYSEAVLKLQELENIKDSLGYNSYLTFSIYADFENCYKQLRDFENAYRYASKRLSLIEAFKS